MHVFDVDEVERCLAPSDHLRLDFRHLRLLPKDDPVFVCTLNPLHARGGRRRLLDVHVSSVDSRVAEGRPGGPAFAYDA